MLQLLQMHRKVDVYLSNLSRVLVRFSAKRGGRAGLPRRGVVFCKGCDLTWLGFVEYVALVSFL